MGSLTSALSIASQSLQAQEIELQVTNNNIANANTPGYTRETVNLSEAGSTQSGSASVGNGVQVDGITSVRDELITLSIQQQTSQQSSANAQVSALDQIETLFPSTGTSISNSLTAFYNSLSSLSANPSSDADRATVITSAQTVVQQFNSVSAGLSGPASALNTDVTTDVSQINQLSSEAATLNQQLSAQNASGQSSGAVGDQLNQVELQLAGLTNISVTHTSEGDSITTGNGTPLVLGNQSYNLQTSTNASGNQAVLDASGTDITSSISGGDLGGTIQVRDTQIPQLTSSLDALANQFATSYNTAQAKGYDQDGNAGAALFSIPTTVAGSAAAISLNTTSGSAIAASSDGSSGSNGNVANLIAAQNTAPASGSNISTLASNLVYQVGNLTANATTQSTSLSLSLTSLNNQQGAVSGVSIDEESANLVRFQQAYEASAKVISTIQSLFSDTISMLN